MILRNQFLFEHAAGDFMDWFAICVIGKVTGLNHLVHDAAFGDGQLKQIHFIDRRHGHKPIAYNLMGVQGEIFTDGALIHPAIGKYKEIFGDIPGALKDFIIG